VRRVVAAGDRVVGPPAGEGSSVADTDARHHRSARPAPPGSWPLAHAAARRLVSPVERFLSVEAASGILLFAAALIALVWANSPFRSAYQAVLHTPLGIRVGSVAFERDLHFWVNDGLMAVFFFVVGLEIKRELKGGQLSQIRRAALPLFAAVGGMLAPAAIYLVLNAGTPGARGWGVPMATDIAFAVGVLTLLGKRVSPALRILLLALAVIDDVGAIVVIAIFYSSGLNIAGLALAAAGILVILAFQKLGLRSAWAYLVPALLTWAGTYYGGVHPTIAGVVVGLLTPASTWFGPDGFVDRANAAVEAARSDDLARDQTRLRATLSDLDTARREAISPLDRLEHRLHGWVAFVIMPLFAICNAGVAIGDLDLAGGAWRTFIGVFLGLVIGKPLGVLVLTRIAVHARLAVLPPGVSWSGVLAIGLVAGIGFTMSLFIASLAFSAGALEDVAKLGILAASVVAAVLGATAGRRLLPRSS
jgi:NhaA family Na+:H+ antiporter